MRLIVTESEDYYIAEQEGGFCPENRVILRSVSQNSFKKSGIYWHYPKSSGVLQALKRAAALTSAELILPENLKKELRRLEGLTQKEAKLRNKVQVYIDDRTKKMAGYVSRQSPPPWHHQQVAYHWARGVDQLYLAHKPGLGKTRSGADIIRGLIQDGRVRQPRSRFVRGHYGHVFESDVIYDHYATVGGILIICPAIVLGTWQDELLKWQGIQGLIINSYNKQRKIEKAAMPAWVHICTYGSLHILEDNRYDAIIVDEAHCLANEDTTQFARAQHLRRYAKFVLALSGTPVSNMLPSLWSQYYFLDGGRTLGSSYEQYKRQYFDVENRKLVARPDSEANIAKRISRITYFLTMQEAFPKKDGHISRVVKVPMTSEQLHYYEKIRNEFAAQIQTGHVTAPEINQKMTKLLQICQGFVIDDDKNVYNFSSAKLKALRNMVVQPDGESYYGHTRTVIWCSLRRDLDRVVEMLREAGVPTLCLHGGITRQEDREHIRDIWNHDYRYRVLVGMIQIGIGINLHAPTCVDAQGRPARCSNTIFYGLTWRVTQLEQAMDRVYRGDQVETCLYTYLLSDDIYGQGDNPQPIDAKVYNTLQTKLDQAKVISEESVEFVRSLIAA